jgi:hypothetical protein
MKKIFIADTIAARHRSWNSCVVNNSLSLVLVIKPNSTITPGTFVFRKRYREILANGLRGDTL